MNFWSLSIFKNYTVEPGSYPGTTRFPLFEKVSPLEFCMGTRFLPYWEPVPTYKMPSFWKFTLGTRFLPTGNRFPRPAESFSAILTAFMHFKPFPIIPIRIIISRTPKYNHYTSLPHHISWFLPSYWLFDTLTVLNSIFRHKIGFNSINL